MNKLIFTLFLAFFVVAANAQKKTAADILKEHKVNTAFEPGEELVYDLKYGIIKAGEFSIIFTLSQNVIQRAWRQNSPKFTIFMKVILTL